MRLELDIDLELLNPTQRLAIEDEEPGLLRLSGGLGGGKTSIGALKALLLSAANEGVPGAIWARSYGSLKATCLRALRELGVPARMLRVHDPSGARFLWWNDIEVFLCTADRAEFRDGINVGWFWSDEARHYKRNALEIMISRMRLECPIPQGFFTSTPGGFLIEHFDGSNPLARTIRAPTSENIHNLSAGYIDRLKKAHSPRMFDAILEGLDVALEGAVYEVLPRDNFWDSAWAIDYQYDRTRRTYMGIDPGIVRSSWFFAQELQHGKGWVIFDELMGDGESDWAMVQAVNQRGYAIDEIWCDPAANNRQSAIHLDTVAMLRGIETRSQDPVRYIWGPMRDIEFGVEKVRAMLGDPSRDINPMLFFARRLKQLEDGAERGIVKDMMGYRYGELDAGRKVVDTPLKDGLTDHSCDAVRYLIVGLVITKIGLDEHAQRMLGKRPGFKVAA